MPLSIFDVPNRKNSFNFQKECSPLSLGVPNWHRNKDRMKGQTHCWSLLLISWKDRCFGQSWVLTECPFKESGWSLLTTARRVPWIDRTQPFLHGTSVHHFCNSFEKPSILWNPGSSRHPCRVPQRHEHGCFIPKSSFFQCRNWALLPSFMRIITKDVAWGLLQSLAAALHCEIWFKKISHKVLVREQHKKFFSFTLPDWKNPGRLVEGGVRIAYALRKEYLFSIFHFMLNHPHAMIFQNNVLQYLFWISCRGFPKVPRTFSRRQSQPTLPQYITIHNP